MPKVREIENDGGNETLKAVFEQERAAFGALLNTTKVYAHCPEILVAAKNLGAAIEQTGRFPAHILSLVYLRVATINGCPF